MAWSSEDCTTTSWGPFTSCSRVWAPWQRGEQRSSVGPKIIDRLRRDIRFDGSWSATLSFHIIYFESHDGLRFIHSWAPAGLFARGQCPAFLFLPTFPFLLPLYLSVLCPFPSSPHFPPSLSTLLSTLRQEMAPLNPARGSGECWIFPQRGEGPGANTFRYILRLWNVSGGNDFDSFYVNQNVVTEANLACTFFQGGGGAQVPPWPCLGGAHAYIQFTQYTKGEKINNS